MLRRFKIQWWFVFPSLILLLKVILFFFQQPNFIYFWDYLGHIQDSLHISWPWIGGWNNFYWGGYPTLLYPSLSHWLLKGLILLSNSDKIGTALFIIVSLVLLCYSLWKLIQQQVASPQLKLVTFSLSLLFYVISPVNSLISLKGTLFSGTITATLAISFLIYLLASQKWYQRGLWLGVLFLTHALTASLGVVFLLIQLIYILLHPIKAHYIKLKEWLYSLLLAVLIGLPWILTFLDQNFQHTAFNITGRIFPLSFICLTLLFISLVLQIINRRTPSRLLIFTILAGLASVLPLWPTKIIELYLFRGIHFYRYYSFLVILTPVSIISISNKFSSKILAKISQTLTKIIILSVIVITIFIPLNPYTYYVETYWDQATQLGEGRVIDTANKNDIDLFTRMADHLLTQNTSLLGSFGLFFESSSTGINYAVAKHLLNKDSYGVPIYEIYIQELASQIGDDSDYLLDLLGINYQAFTSPNKIEENTTTFAMIDVRDEKKGLHKQSYYHLKKINDSRLVEPLSKMVEVNPDLDLWTWWSNPEKKLTAREEHQPPVSVNLGQPQVTGLKVKNDQISFNVNSQAPAPIYLKFSYSPYWQATAINPDSFVSQPLWITPGNMMVYAVGEVSLKWQNPSYLKKFGPLSLVTLATTIIIAIIEKLKNTNSN